MRSLSLLLALLLASFPVQAQVSPGNGGGALPVGAATSANQNSTAAGTSATNAQAVQGVTGGVPLSTVGLLSGAVTNPTSTLTMTSATTAYAANQLIATSATGTSFVVPSFAIAASAGGAALPRLRLSTNDTTSTAWGGVSLQVDLWTTAPTFASGSGDRSTFTPATGTGAHIGSYSCTVSAEYGDGAYAECAPNVGNFALPKLASGTAIYWTLQALSASGVTGASKVWTLTAETLN